MQYLGSYTDESSLLKLQILQPTPVMNEAYLTNFKPPVLGLNAVILMDINQKHGKVEDLYGPEEWNLQNFAADTFIPSENVEPHIHYFKNGRGAVFTSSSGHSHTKIVDGYRPIKSALLKVKDNLLNGSDRNRGSTQACLDEIEKLLKDAW